jgi:hypothetical protein
VSRLLNDARALEAEARAGLAKIPTFARVSYPEYVRSAENFCDRLSLLRREIELIEGVTTLSPSGPGSNS